MNAELVKYAPLYASVNAIAAIDDKSDASAFLLGGEDDEGLKVAARIVAAKLCGLSTDEAFKEHADITVYPRPDEEKKPKGKKAEAEKNKRYTVSVDDIREIIDSLYLTPFELDKKIIIIENAESMSEICQNKLLKSLEEPPPRVCFVLCTSGKLLPTVESRCNRVELAPFDRSVIERELMKYHSDRTAVSLAARACCGSLGRAETILADPGYADMYASCKKILALATGSRMFARVAAIYEKFTRDKIDSALDILEYLLCDVARLLSGAPTVFEESDIRSIAAGYSAYSAASCAETVRSARKYNAANCMPSAVMDGLILKIMEEKALCQKYWA